MPFIRRLKEMFKKVVNKVRKYADGGNVASGPNYGASQLNPVMGSGAGGAYPPSPQAPQARFGIANPPAFAQKNGTRGPMAPNPTPFKKGGKVKAKAKKKTKTSTSKRADGIAQRGKTRGKMV
jgi:hypothetical protein